MGILLKNAYKGNHAQKGRVPAVPWCHLEHIEVVTQFIHEARKSKGLDVTNAYISYLHKLLEIALT